MKLLNLFPELSLNKSNISDIKFLIFNLALKGFLTRKAQGNKTKCNDKVDGYYDLPDGWYWDSFENVCLFDMGKTPPSKDLVYWGGSYPWVSIADMKPLSIIHETKKTISKKALTEHFNNKLIKAGTLIMSFKLTIGRTSILGVDACHNEAIISIYPKSCVLKEYLFLFMPIISNWGDHVNAIKGKTLNKSKIKALKLPVPPIEEQKSIVETVNELLQELNELETLNKERIKLKEDFVESALNKLSSSEDTSQEWNYLVPHFKTFFTEKKSVKSLRETILRLAVQGKLTKKWREKNPNVEPASELLERIDLEKQQLITKKRVKKEKPLPLIELNDAPYVLHESWIWTRFGKIVINRDGERKPITKSERIKGDYDYYGASGVIDKVNDYIFEDDLLLIGEDGANLINRSTPIAFFARGKYWVNNHAHVLDSPFIEILEYLEVYINGINLEDYITGMAQPKMPQKRMNIIPVPLPPIKEQKVIVEKVNSLMALCDELEEQIINSETQIELLMKSCLKEALEI